MIMRMVVFAMVVMDRLGMRMTRMILVPRISVMSGHETCFLEPCGTHFATTKANQAIDASGLIPVSLDTSLALGIGLGATTSAMAESGKE